MKQCLKKVVVGRQGVAAAFGIHARSLFLSRGMLAPKVKPGKKGQDKKDGRGGETTENKEEQKAHIFNIYNTVEKDHEILPDHAYPKWLWDLEKPMKSYGELALMFLYGKNVEKATADDYHRFRRLHNKNLIKLNNMRLKKSKRSTVKPVFWDL
ncbi:mitochondrial ribosomal protein L37, putative [Plasmodium knowlesi strain H]|uniref:Large ribosomal subunit protein mL54 n=3 Tax=Plasmodium knowlesi TaxID=5850 RepID=A0A5K1VBC9_PLAKH|nr:ribosomal protein L37, mitochondrial, putative [Plasmodium knowlesi strain H]OTN65201.1 putative Mitochondrial ribosomal protein L37 [Plasmodium knowlesi]CAA9988262.1 ribosomal protein L37, mitochondrial, putative [Plasmodium knowlesi strain H]SBO20197.1 mitochondrial ribosomal protein L37, putative [Plasmodium knowlesi strain H]SBO20434.1 mitochondrial ribosomal protein L37, putative [Plasmodium knowlesi strain H]VVS77736.1 ribosomal protein L37, mitochondrial, putative [Plasmodium knowles|eukprot:XP_002259239.1 mitochondrial ribosomal protein L37, putative [Plasmodium knowlesi strain H]